MWIWPIFTGNPEPLQAARTLAAINHNGKPSSYGPTRIRDEIKASGNELSLKAVIPSGPGAAFQRKARMTSFQAAKLSESM